MIYLDASVALAHLLAEDRVPPDWIWDQTLVASRLLEYEIWNRLHAANVAESHAEAAHLLIGRVALLELSAPVLTRALEPFPHRARTLDALHLASADFLRSNGQSLELATYDRRMATTAQAMGFDLVPLDKPNVKG